MATAIAADQQGAYEVTLTPGTSSTFVVQPAFPLIGLQIIVHDSDSPVYAMAGTSAAIKDPAAVIVPSNTWFDYPTTGRVTTFTLICAGNATVSVARK